MAAAQMLVDVEEGDNDDGSYEQPRDIVGVGGGGRGGGDAGFRRRSGLIIKKPFGASRATEATRVSGGGSEMFAWSTEDVCEWLAREDFRGVDVTALSGARGFEHDWLSCAFGVPCPVCPKLSNKLRCWAPLYICLVR